MKVKTFYTDAFDDDSFDEEVNRFLEGKTIISMNTSEAGYVDSRDINYYSHSLTILYEEVAAK